MNEARISVIVAVYNREHTIDRCIDSIMFQTYQAFEPMAYRFCCLLSAFPAWP